MMEDFEPFKQTKLIPLFLDGKKYYFFYGSHERPYEVLKQFYEIIFSLDIEELNNIKFEFLFSLQRQTDILIKLNSDNETQFETTSMYVPSLDFFNKNKYFFEVDNANIEYLHNSRKLPSLTEIEKMFDFGINNSVSNSNVPQLEIDDIELVLVGPNLYHAWETYKCKEKNIHEITIQFDEKLFDDNLLSRRIMRPIRDMFNRSSHGILFSYSTAEYLSKRICNLSRLDGMDYFLEKY